MGQWTAPGRWNASRLNDDTSQFDYELHILLCIIGDWLTTKRDRANLSQGQLAALLGLQQSRISKIENARFDMRLSLLLRMAVLFNHDPFEWLPSIRQMRHKAWQIGAWAVPRKGAGLLKYEQELRERERCAKARRAQLLQA